jgi:hypothetical protein
VINQTVAILLIIGNTIGIIKNSTELSHNPSITAKIYRDCMTEVSNVLHEGVFFLLLLKYIFGTTRLKTLEVCDKKLEIIQFQTLNTSLINVL